MRLPRILTARGLVWAAVACMLLGIAFETHRALHAEYVNEVEDILSASDRTAQKLASRTTEVLDRVNQATRLIGFMRERGGAPDLGALRQAGVIPVDVLQSIYTTDSQGAVTDSTSTASTAATPNVAGDDFFKHHRQHADVDLYMAPTRANPLDGRWGIPMTRRLGSGAAFEGLIVATIDPAALLVPYAKTEEKGTAVSLLGMDGLFRSHAVDSELTFGQHGNPVRIFARAAEVHETRQPFISTLDGVSRFLSAVPVDRYPVIAVVAVDAANALAGYRRSRDRILSWAAAIAMVSVGVGWLMGEQFRRQDASRRRATDAEAAFRATVEGSLDAVSILHAKRDAAGRIVTLVIADCNTLTGTLLSRTREQLIGSDFCTLLPSLAAGDFLGYCETVIRTQQPIQAEIQSIEPNLLGRWFHHQLVPLSEGVAFITREISDQKASERALAALASTDSLTGLANRRQFAELAGAARARALRATQPMVALLIDLDAFKAVNDRFGHAAGDAVLAEVARRLREVLRETDVIARLGGDEFAVVAESVASQSHIEEVCQRILAALKAPHHHDGRLIVATPSVGVAVFDGSESVESLCRRADAAMYAAKALGKSRYVIAGVELLPRLPAHAAQA